VTSLPAYYVLIVAGHGHAVPRDADSFVSPTLVQRVRALFAGRLPARTVPLGRPRPA
jgi:hypothetical protein